MELFAGFITFPHGTELIIILLVILLIFGPKNLPKLGTAIGRFTHNLRAGKDGEELEDNSDLEDEAPKAQKSKSE